MDCAVDSHKAHGRAGFTRPALAPKPCQATIPVHMFIPTKRNFTAQRAPSEEEHQQQQQQRQESQPSHDDESPDFPSPPDFLDQLNEDTVTDEPDKINNLVLTDSSHSMDQQEDHVVISSDIEPNPHHQQQQPADSSVVQHKRPPHPFSGDNDLLSDKATPLVLAAVRDKLLHLKTNNELPSEDSSLGAFSETDSYSLDGDGSGSSQYSDEPDIPQHVPSHHRQQPRPSMVVQSAPGIFISMPRKASPSSSNKQQASVTPPSSEARSSSSSSSSSLQSLSAPRRSSDGSVFISGLSEKYIRKPSSPSPQLVEVKARRPSSLMPQLVEGKVSDTMDSLDVPARQSGKSGSLSDVRDTQGSSGSNVFVSLPRTTSKSPSLPRRSSMPSLPLSHSPLMTTYISLGQSKENLAGDSPSMSAPLDRDAAIGARPSFNKSASQPNGDLGSISNAQRQARSASQSNLHQQDHGSTGSVFVSMPNAAIPPRPRGSLPRGMSMPNFATSVATPRMSTFMSMGKRKPENSSDVSHTSTLSREDKTASLQQQRAGRWKSLDTLLTPKRGQPPSRSPSCQRGANPNRMHSSASSGQLADGAPPAASKSRRSSTVFMASSEQLADGAPPAASKSRRSSAVFMAMPTSGSTGRSPSATPQRHESVRELPAENAPQDKEGRRKSFPRRRVSENQAAPIMVMSLGWK